MSSPSTSSSSRTTQPNAYFETGPNHLLCEVPGINDDSFPKEFQNTWDLDHVRLPCSERIYKTDVSMWPEIVRGLSEPILTSQQLSEVMLRWNKGKQNGWNINALDAFLNSRSDHEGNIVDGPGAQSDEILDPRESRAAVDALDSDDEYLSRSDQEDYYDHGSSGPQGQHRQQQQHSITSSSSSPASSSLSLGQVPTTGPLTSQYLSREERQYFFGILLPRMQALALRMPELIKQPIPFLKQQQDSAVTLSQEQIACLLANAFFNTFPCRNTPYKRGRKKRAQYPRQQDGQRRNSGSQQGQQGQGDDDEDEDSEDGEEEQQPHPYKGKKNNRGSTSASSSRGGRGGSRGGGNQRQLQLQQQGAFSRKKSLQAPRPPRKRRSRGLAAQFEFFEDEPYQQLATSVQSLTVKDSQDTTEVGTGAADTDYTNSDEKREWVPKMPSINFISTFWNEENKYPCTTTQAARLRCLLHYFDRVTMEMPQGTVTYHRQVLKRPAYMNPGERLKGDEFRFSKVSVDSVTPIEEAPKGALQLDFANKNIGGGALDKGAVQEEIRFMICPELIVSRLFTQQLEANEAILIKGAERYSNYIGYSKTFEWYSDHRDSTPRDKLGRRMTEICAIDARPFKSRISRLEQLERHYVLREINKALTGFRVSPINSCEWGLVRPERTGEANESCKSTQKDIYRPIATGNWGCGAFGGHLQLKFVLQWIAASICGAFSDADDRVRDDMLYYTFGMHELKDEIETF
ncbi:hypothetical protein EDD11_005173 [Mortierella claussenii]|nr:hypothetical protein EDD11_005173 [Mortierella claussenii]